MFPGFDYASCYRSWDGNPSRFDNLQRHHTQETVGLENPASRDHGFMSTQSPQTEFAIGFLTVINAKGFGSCGGLLVVNELGRPIEFHCTAPVSPNRTQQILYGKSLESFLYCDQIGKTLLKQSKSNVNLIITDLAPLSSLETNENQVLVLIVDKSEIATLDIDHSNAKRIDLGQESATLVYAFGTTDVTFNETEAMVRQFSEMLPLDEPFERIENAIDEAQSVAR